MFVGFTHFQLRLPDTQRRISKQLWAVELITDNYQSPVTSHFSRGEQPLALSSGLGNFRSSAIFAVPD
jgi:hypothetical protein